MAPKIEQTTYEEDHKLPNLPKMPNPSASDLKRGFTRAEKFDGSVTDGDKKGQMA